MVPGARSGRSSRAGWGSKVTATHSAPRSRRLLPSELQSHPVTPVDAVEVADRHDGRPRRGAAVRPARRGGQLAEALDSHRPGAWERSMYAIRSW